MKILEDLIKDGKRIDGRGLEEFRPIEMEVDVVTSADGSAKVSFGDTTVIASAFGPRHMYPRFLQEQESCVLRCRYGMAPFSVDERKKPGPDRRSIELSKITRVALEPAIFLEDFPKVAIDVFADVIQADGSTRVTGINAASLALAAAGVPMRDLVVACSVGKVNGQLVIDLNGIEDNNSDADITFVMIPTKKKVTMLQMDGILTRDELHKLFDLGVRSCEKIYELQRKALRARYGNGD